MSIEPNWISGESDRAEKLIKSGQGVNNPSAKIVSQKNQLERSLKGFRIRKDYQRIFDELVAREKHISGKKGPDLLEEALEMLFDKYK